MFVLGDGEISGQTGFTSFVTHVKVCNCLLQAIKCRLADLPVPEGDWSQEAILWVKEAVMGSEACKMKVISTSKNRLGKCC